MKKIIAAAAVGALFVATGAFAQTAPKDVKPGAYKVEGYHTQVLFSVSHFGLSNFAGVYSGATGTLNINPAKPSESKLEVAIDTATVQTISPKLTEELKDDKWLDSAKFPKAAFVSTKVTPEGDNAATIEGNLTLHGVTKPLTLKAKYVGAGVNPINKHYTLGFEATGTVKRTDFGVSTYAPYIGDNVTLTINGAFELQD